MWVSLWPWTVVMPSAVLLLNFAKCACTPAQMPTMGSRPAALGSTPQEVKLELIANIIITRLLLHLGESRAFAAPCPAAMLT